MQKHVLKAEYTGEDINFQGVTYTGTDGLGKLCRHLQAEGHGDDTLEIYRGRMLCGRVPKISGRAGKALSEHDHYGFRTNTYKPFPRNLAKKCERV